MDKVIAAVKTKDPKKILKAIYKRILKKKNDE